MNIMKISLALLGACIFSAYAAKADISLIPGDLTEEIGSIIPGYVDGGSACRSVCNIYAPQGPVGWMVNVSLPGSFPSEGGINVSGVGHIYPNPTNDPNASPASRQACGQVAQTICNNPQTWDCDSVLLTGGSALNFPLLKRCH